MKENKRHHRVQKAEADIQSAVDEQFDVVGDALIRVIGDIALQLHAVVVGVIQPLHEIALRHPFAPPDLQPLVQIELINRERDEGCGQHAEITDLVDEIVPVAFLQGIVKAVVPGIQQH